MLFKNDTHGLSTTKKYLDTAGLGHLSSLIVSFVRNYASPKSHNHDGVYAKSAHTHTTAQVTGLDSALAGKASTSHNHNGVYAPSSHNHSADNITSGVLPIGRGGTGASNSKAAQYNIMKDVLEGTVNASDNDVFVMKHHTPTATDGALLTRSATQVWTWIKSKCDGLYQPRGSYASSSHTHTIANVSNLQSTLDSKAPVSHTHSNATATASGFMSNTDKSKLDGVSTGANKTIVDASFSATSTNPVQNKVVKAALDAKASSSHTHTTSQVSGLDAALSGKAPTSHTHTIAQVTNLQSQLDSKVPVGRLINKKPLSADMTLTPADIGADAAGAATNALNSAKQYTDTVAAGKAAKSHVHDATNITTGTLSQDRLPLVPVAKGGTGATSVSGVRNMIGVNPITTTGSGSAYVASVPHISTLVAGATFTMVPHVVSAAVSPTLNVNNLGAKPIRQRLSNSTLSTAPGATANWLAAGKPVEVMYDGQFWVVDFVRPNMASAYGVLPVENGGTGKTTCRDAISALAHEAVPATAVPNDDNWVLCSDISDTTDTKNAPVTRRKLSAIWSYIKSKCDAVYQAKGSYAAASHTHNASEITNLFDYIKNKTIGSDIPNLPSDADLNNYKTPGVYCHPSNGGNIKNSPYGSEQAFRLVVFCSLGSNSTYIGQRVNGYSGNHISYTRYYDPFAGSGGTWGKWHTNSTSSGSGSGSSGGVNLGKLMYPVGAVYISWSSTSPASIFGGSWVAITGRFPYFNAGTGTGGSNSHTLSINEMPSHNHETHSGVYQEPAAMYRSVMTTNNVWSTNDGAQINYRGGGAAHNNMPAYQTLYAWRRTA